METERLDDLTRLGRYSVLLCVWSEFIIFSQLANMLYMVYAGTEPSIISCGEHDLIHLSPKERCERIDQLQANPNTSCILNFDIQFESVNVEWDHFCGSTKDVKSSTSIQMIGVMLGSIMFGQLSDMFGRKLITLICLFGCITLSFASSYMPTLFWFTVCRFFIGMFNGGQTTTFLVYLIENLPKAHRLWINTAISWSPNLVIYAVVAYYAQNWRTLARVISIASIPSFVLCLFLYESPRLLVQKGRIDEAKRVIMGIAKFNRQKAFDERRVDAILKREQQILSASSGKKHYHLFHLFYSWKFAAYTTVIAFSFMVTSIFNYGLLFNMEKLSGSIYWNSALVGIIRYIYNLLCAAVDYKVTWIGRKAMHASTLVPVVICIVFILILQFTGLQQDLALYSRIALLGVSALISQSYIVNGVCTNELFPTPVRNLAYAFTQLMSRLGVVISPQLFYLADFWTPLPYITMAALALFDLILFECLIPETKGHPLKDHMPGRKNHIFASSAK